jgi:hypothetical protein
MIFEETEKWTIVSGENEARQSSSARIESVQDRLKAKLQQIDRGFVEINSAMKGLTESIERLRNTVDRFLRGRNHEG